MPTKQGSLHYTPEHCLVNGGCFFFGGKGYDSNRQNVLFKEPCQSGSILRTAASEHSIAGLQDIRGPALGGSRTVPVLHDPNLTLLLSVGVSTNVRYLNSHSYAIYIYMYACIYMCIYIYMYMHVHIYIYTHIHIYIYAYIYICIQTSPYMHCIAYANTARRKLG